jgi:hypothetical protein
MRCLVAGARFLFLLSARQPPPETDGMMHLYLHAPCVTHVLRQIEENLEEDHAPALFGPLPEPVSDERFKCIASQLRRNPNYCEDIQMLMLSTRHQCLMRQLWLIERWLDEGHIDCNEAGFMRAMCERTEDQE